MESALSKPCTDGFCLILLLHWQEPQTKGNTARRWLWGTSVPPFFAGNRRPEGLPGTVRGREIQQTLTGDPPGTPPYFVSLFDPTENTPFYSAYKVTPTQAANLGTFGRDAINTKNWRNPPGMFTVKNCNLLLLTLQITTAS